MINMKICSICKNKITFGKAKSVLNDTSENQFIYCADCYKQLSKEEKKNFLFNTKLSKNIKLVVLLVPQVQVMKGQYKKVKRNIIIVQNN